MRSRADLSEVLEVCDRVALESGGAFDAYRGGRFDPAAFVEGGRLNAPGSCCASTAARTGPSTPDVRVSSSSLDRSPWRIGVRRPFDRSLIGMVLHAHDLAVATSGRFERGDHVDDPRSLPASHLRDHDRAPRLPRLRPVHRLGRRRRGVRCFPARPHPRRTSPQATPSSRSRHDHHIGRPAPAAIAQHALGDRVSGS